MLCGIYCVIGMIMGIFSRWAHTCTWTNDGLFDWCIYASLGHKGLNSLRVLTLCLKIALSDARPKSAQLSMILSVSLGYLGFPKMFLLVSCQIANEKIWVKTTWHRTMFPAYSTRDAGFWEIGVSFHWAERRLTVRSREVSKPWDWRYRPVICAIKCQAIGRLKSTSRSLAMSRDLVIKKTLFHLANLVPKNVHGK